MTVEKEAVALIRYGTAHRACALCAVLWLLNSTALYNELQLPLLYAFGTSYLFTVPNFVVWAISVSL